MIDTIAFGIVGGILKPPPPRIVNCLKYPGFDSVKSPLISPSPSPSSPQPPGFLLKGCSDRSRFELLNHDHDNLLYH